MQQQPKGAYRAAYEQSDSADSQRPLAMRVLCLTKLWELYDFVWEVVYYSWRLKNRKRLFSRKLLTSHSSCPFAT